MFKALQSLNSRQRHTFLACFLGWSLDAFDFFLLVFIIPAIATSFHSSIADVGLAVTLTLAFRPVGAILFGYLADRFGRQPTLMLNIACYSILEVSCAFAGSLHSLLILRALFGIAMGGEWGVGAALALESLPREGRGFFSGILQEGYSVGYLLASLAYATVYPALAHIHWHGTAIGWRGIFILGALPAFVVLYIRRNVEESPAWAASRLPGSAHRPEPTNQSRAAWWNSIRSYAPTFLFLILLMTGFNALSHGTQDLYPTFLQKQLHFSPRLTGNIGIIYNIGAIFGGIFFGAISEKIGRKKAILLAVLLTLPAIPLWSLTHSPYTLASGAFLMQFMVQGAWGVVPAYLVELSPGPVRATFPGLAYQLGNLLMSGNIFLQASIAEHFHSYGGMLAISVLIIAIYLAIVTSFGRESRGTELTI
jgi:SHS family lactate transporter-like MFS transporter